MKPYQFETMSAQLNIKHMENLQQQSEADMQSKDKSGVESKLFNLITQEESTFSPLDLRQVLQIEQIEYTNWEGDSLPPLFVAMTPYMIGKFAKYRKACNFVLMPAVIQSDQGLKDIGLLMALNSNLEPSVLAFAIFKSVEVCAVDALESLLKFVNQRCEIDNTVLFCDGPEQYQKRISEYNGLYSKRIELQPTFAQKQCQLRQILTNASILKKPYLKKQAFELITLLLEEKDEKKFNKALEKFKQMNLHGYNKLTSQPRKFKFIFELPHQFYGFSMFKKYSCLIQSFSRKIRREKFTSEAQFVNRILHQEYQEMELKRTPCPDICSIFQINSRVKDLQHYFQPNPLSQFLDNYEKSLSFKHKKVQSGKYIIGGKAGSAYQVTKHPENGWICQCGQSIRIGLPCQHLLKICSIQKLSFEDQIDSMYRIGHQKPFLRLD